MQHSVCKAKPRRNSCVSALLAKVVKTKLGVQDVLNSRASASDIPT